MAILETEIAPRVPETVLPKVDGQEIDSGKTIYPPIEDVFTALNLCPFDKTRVRTYTMHIDQFEYHILTLWYPQVVIIGQDPYHGERAEVVVQNSFKH